MFGDERESNRLDTLLSVAILILLYFIVIQNLFQSRTTKKELAVDIWSGNHPFYTGSQKIIDTEGRVEKFERKYGNYSNKTESEKEENKLT
jgi:ribosomal protein L31